jgi:hypothetical protein
MENRSKAEDEDENEDEDEEGSVRNNSRKRREG